MRDSGFWFWVLLIIAVIFGWCSGNPKYIWAQRGFPIVLVILLGLLCWTVFGAPIEK